MPITSRKQFFKVLRTTLGKDILETRYRSERECRLVFHQGKQLTIDKLQHAIELSAEKLNLGSVIYPYGKLIGMCEFYLWHMSITYTDKTGFPKPVRLSTGVNIFIQ